MQSNKIIGRKVAIRFDAGTATKKHEFTPEGYLRAEATFARDGVLQYLTSDGKIRRELRTPEANKQALTSFGLKPISFEHPHELINSENAKQYSVGLSDSTVVYEDGFVKGVITVLDSEAVKSIKDKETVQISAGYKCNIIPKPGVWKGQHYDAIQTDLEINHIAITKKGRAGEEVAIHLDSNFQNEDVAFEIQQSKKAMARVTIDSVSYDEIPETFASVVGTKISEYEKTKLKLDGVETEIITLRNQLKEAEEERDRALGRVDGYEEIVNSAIPILEEHGYSWNSDSAEFITDSKKAKKPMPEEEWNEGEPEDEDEDEPEDEAMPSSKRKTKKTDSVAQIVSTLRKAELLLGDSFDDSRFDSDDLDADSIRRSTLQELLPDQDLSGYHPGWIEGLFDAMHLQSFSDEEEEPHVDSTLQDMIKIARIPNSTTAISQNERSQSLANAWQEPLSLSR